MKTKENDTFNQPLTDLHTHILHGVDDGAKSLDMALEMLRMQKESGVQRVMLTSHFVLQEEPEESFLKYRRRAYKRLRHHWQENTMPEVDLGAEVRFTPALINVDLREFTFGQRDYLLLELPNMGVPAYLEKIVEEMLRQKITPILAHIERCAYFRAEPDRLKKLIEMGALAQVTARAINDKKDRCFAKTCLKKGLAHMIASDLHVSVQEQCLGNVAQQLDPVLVKRAEEFALCIWENKPLPDFSVRSVRKGLFGYF